MISKIEATHAVMIYSSTGLDYAVAYDKDDGEWVNPRPMTGYELEDILTDREPMKPTILPERILWYERNKFMMWYSPPSRREINLSKVSKSKMKHYSHPGIVFILNQLRLHVAIVTRSDLKFKPAMQSELYVSPYRGIDIHSTTGIMGACGVRKHMPTKEVTYDLSTFGWQEWESGFYESEFNYAPDRRDRLKKSSQTLSEYIDRIIV